MGLAKTGLNSEVVLILGGLNSEIVLLYFDTRPYIFINDWFNKGVRFISDLLDRKGNIYEFQTLKDIYGLRGTF